MMADEAAPGLMARATMGLGLLGTGLRLLWRHPSLFLPMALFWCFWATMSVVWHFVLLPALLDAGASWSFRVGLVLGLICLASFALSLACLVLLEQLEQLERGQKVSFRRALVEALSDDTPRALPVMALFALGWFVLNLLANLLGAGRPRQDLTAGNVARHLAGEGASQVAAAAHRLMRLALFTILPAIAWEDYWAPGAVGRGWAVMKRQLGRFVAGFVALETASFIIAFVTVLLLYSGGFVAIVLIVEGATLVEANLPTLQQFGAAHPWLGALPLQQVVDFVGHSLVILYLGVMGSLMLYLEQIYAAGLYLWYLAWEREAAARARDGRPEPTMEDVPCPSFLDDVPDLTRLVPVAAETDDEEEGA